jgi:hypothetical protein
MAGPRLVRPGQRPGDPLVYPVRLPPPGTQGLGRMEPGRHRPPEMQARPMGPGQVVAGRRVGAPTRVVGADGVPYCQICSQAGTHSVQGADGIMHNGACPVLQQIGALAPGAQTVGAQTVGANPADMHPSNWPYGGDHLPPIHIPGNPIDSYHAQQDDDSQENPQKGGGSGSGGDGSSETVTLHGGSTRSSAASAASDKAIEKTLTNLLQFESSQLKPLGRLGGTIVLTAVPNPDIASATKLIYDQEIARLEGKKAGTRVTLYSKNGPFLGLSAITGDAVGAEDFTSVGNGSQPRVLLKIIVGGGNTAGGDQVLQVVPAGTPVTLAGEALYVTAGVYLDELGLQPFSIDNGSTFSVTVSAFFSVQGDHTDQKNTQWVLPLAPLAQAGGIPNQFGGLVYGPRHLKQAEGFASAANTDTTYLMFFDWNGSPTAFPGVGNAPLFAFPVPPGKTFSWDCISSARKFEWGLVWALSSAPDFYDPDVGSLARVDLELYSDLQVNP